MTSENLSIGAIIRDSFLTLSYLYSRGKKHTFERKLSAGLKRGSDLGGPIGAHSERKCAERV